MSNETFKLMVLGDYIASEFKHNPLFIFVRPATTGKTHTINIFLESCDTGYILPPATPTKSFNATKQRALSITTIIIDDLDDWNNKNDFIDAIQLCKHLADGALIPSRKTSFSEIGSIPQRSQAILFINDNQWDRAYKLIEGTGFLARAVVIWSTHSKEERVKIDDFYLKGGFSSHNLPKFADFEIKNPATPLEKLDKKTVLWIGRHFMGHSRKTLLHIARLVSAKQFKDFMPFLLSWRNFRFENEFIKFAKEGRREE